MDEIISASYSSSSCKRNIPMDNEQARLYRLQSECKCRLLEYRPQVMSVIDETGRHMSAFHSITGRQIDWAQPSSLVDIVRSSKTNPRYFSNRVSYEMPSTARYISAHQGWREKDKIGRSIREFIEWICSDVFSTSFTWRSVVAYTYYILFEGELITDGQYSLRKEQKFFRMSGFQEDQAKLIQLEYDQLTSALDNDMATCQLSHLLPDVLVGIVTGYLYELELIECQRMLEQRKAEKMSAMTGKQEEDEDEQRPAKRVRHDDKEESSDSTA
jgi:hypothetical protein